jgi:hypothetical protein
MYLKGIKWELKVFALSIMLICLSILKVRHHDRPVRYFQLPAYKQPPFSLKARYEAFTKLRMFYRVNHSIIWSPNDNRRLRVPSWTEFLIYWGEF